MSFIAAHYDAALEVDETDTVDSITEAELARLAKNVNLCALVLSIPRRLGGDAADEELALDKRRAKRVLHAENQSYAAWGGTTLPLAEDGLNQEAAQLDWKRWLQEQDAWLTARIRYLVTWGRKTGADEAWIKSSVVRLTNEQRWVNYALRD